MRGNERKWWAGCWMVIFGFPVYWKSFTVSRFDFSFGVSATNISTLKIKITSNQRYKLNENYFQTRQHCTNIDMTLSYQTANESLNIIHANISLFVLTDLVTIEIMRFCRTFVVIWGLFEVGLVGGTDTRQTSIFTHECWGEDEEAKEERLGAN